MNRLIKKNNIFILDTPFKEITIGVVGRTINKIDYNRELNLIRNDEKELLHRISGLDKDDLFFLNQVHGDEIVYINPDDKCKNTFFADADGVITLTKNKSIIIRTADCVPIIIYDRKNNILAGIHSGWKGTKLSITGKAVKKMKKKYNSISEDIFAFILPSIGPELYEVKNDVSDNFTIGVKEENGRITLNLWENIIASLLDEGVPERNIYNSGICNLENKDEFFTHRGGDSGRNLNFAFIKN